MPLLKTDFQRINQPLADVRTSDQPVDHNKYIIETVELKIVRRLQLNNLAFVEEACEATLHKAHDVSGDGMTRGALDGPF
jgi:hypothetical protein